MEIAICSSVDEAARRVAGLVVETLAGRPGAVLALPAGNTPRPVYEELVRLEAAGRVSFGRAAVFTLDEYVGLAGGHPGAFRRFVWESLLRPLRAPPERVQAPDGIATDLAAAAAAYEQAIAAAGGLDLALLGIGGNGHIAFNEPGSSFDSRTRVVTLSEESRAANRAAFAPGPVPVQAITVGIATLLEARQCVLLATGAGKAAAVASALEGPITDSVPASALRHHPRALAVLDQAAASRLTGRPG